LDHCPRIHLLNWQPHDSLHEIYILSDVFVIPSRFEGLPITILEAMAASLHILYTPVGSLPEILEDYSSKTMIKESNTQEIYLNLKRVIGNGFDSFVFDYDLSEIIPFDWKNITLKIYQFYQSILESEHRIRD
jgi:glycosyltransferase involved in cell wall biosynthesis